MKRFICPSCFGTFTKPGKCKVCKVNLEEHEEEEELDADAFESGDEGGDDY